MKRKRTKTGTLPKQKKQKIGHRLSDYFIDNHIDGYDNKELKEFIKLIDDDEEKLFEKVIQLFKFKKSFEYPMGSLKCTERAEEDMCHNIVNDVCHVVEVFETVFLKDIFNDKFEECETCGEIYKNSFHTSKNCEKYKSELL